MPDYMNYNTPIGAADGGHITRTNYAGGGEAGLEKGKEGLN